MMKTCEVCKESVPKYRCPSCCIQYCSVLCFKTHKADTCERETNKLKEEKEKERVLTSQFNSKPETEEGELPHSDSEDEDKVNQKVLDKLGQSEQLKTILRNKHLQQMIADIDRSSSPNEDLKTAMQIPIFTEFVDECLKTVDSSLE